MYPIIPSSVMHKSDSYSGFPSPMADALKGSVRLTLTPASASLYFRAASVSAESSSVPASSVAASSAATTESAEFSTHQFEMNG